jgi:hypothetical protein
VKNEKTDDEESEDELGERSRESEDKEVEGCWRELT